MSMLFLFMLAAYVNLKAQQTCTPPSITGTVPGSRCGIGTVTLRATGDPGAVINWYNAPVGGTPVTTGSVFTTPILSTTTNFYVAAGNVSAGSKKIGNGSSTGQSAPYCFAYGDNGGLKAQYLYTAAELLNAGFRAGNMTSLGFSLTTVGAQMKGFTIQMGTTSINSFTTTNLLGGLTTVYPSSNYTPASGMNTLNFQTPYNWDGASNIIISISWSNANIGSGNSSTIAYDTTSNYSSQMYMDDSQTAAYMLAYTGSNSGPDGILRRSQSRPMFAINGMGICEGPRMAVAATLNQPPALSLTTGTSVCANTVLRLDVTSSLANYNTYTWSPVSNLYADAGATLPYTGGSATTVYYKSATYNSIVYSVNATNSVSGCGNTASTSVIANAPVINATANPTMICSGSPVNLNATVPVMSNGTVAIGSAAYTTGSNEELTAFCNKRQNYRMQTIYTAAELNAAGLYAGNITAIGYRTSAFGASSTNTNYTVKCGTTTATTFTNYIPATGFTTVFPAATYIRTVSFGFNTINFATPYFWDGISNLVIEVSHDGINGNSNAGTFYSPTIANTVVYGYNNALNGTPSDRRLNIVFTGQTVTQGAGNLSWQWNPGAINSNTTTITPVNPGISPISSNYTVMATDPVTTCSNSAVLTITVNPTPTVATSASTPSLCSGTSASLTATGATTYSWIPAGGTASLAVVNPASSTIYTVTGATAGCSSTQTISLHVIITPTVLASTSSGAICSGATINLTATGAGSYTWLPGSAMTASITATPTTSTTYTVTGKNLTCSNSKTVSVTVNQIPVLTFTVNPSNALLCTTGATATLTAAGTSTAYLWSGGVNTASIVVAPSATSSYTVTGINSCGSTTTVIPVSVAKTPTISAASSSILSCADNAVVLTTDATPGVSYLWNTGATTSSISVSPGQTTTYTVTGTNACGTATATIVQSVFTCTGIQDLTTTGEVNIYPNPANDYINITIPASLTSVNTTIEVTDALGKVIMKHLLTEDTTTLNTDILNEGVYFFKVSSNNQIIKIGKVLKR